MLKAKDFRKYAREALKGNWLKAGLVSVLAGFLGASIGISGMSSGSMGGAAETESEWLEPFLGNFGGTAETSATVIAVALGVCLVVVLWAIMALIIGGATTLGYAKYNLNLVDAQEAKVKDLFSQYHRLGTGFGMQFFRNLYVSLWSLLFVIPGLIANFSYYMTPFILCENPDMTAREAIKESKKLMKGNKWRLFCLEFSFWGWYLLAMLVLSTMMLVAFVPLAVAGEGALGVAAGVTGIFLVIFVFLILIVFGLALNFLLTPYITASVAVFYREISREAYAQNYSESEVVDTFYTDDTEKDDTQYIEV